MNAWLWPDHQIGKRESRRLREDHNKLVNSHAEILEALRKFLEQAESYHNTCGHDEEGAATQCDSICELIKPTRSLVARIAPTKHEAKTQRGLFFWAEQIPVLHPDAWHVVSQANGFAATESHDDWFANFKDADDIARQLAENYTTEEDK